MHIKELSVLLQFTTTWKPDTKRQKSTFFENLQVTKHFFILLLGILSRDGDDSNENDRQQ